MTTHNYTYNYRFLADWIRENKNVQRREILDALGINDYKTLQNWTEGVTMMPLTQMMRFCNHYSVPLGCFFYDMNARANIDAEGPDVNSQTEPRGGWKECEGKRGRHIYDPTTTIHMISKIPDEEGIPVHPETSLARKGDCEEGRNGTSETETSCEQYIREEYERKTHAERMKYLDIIKEQNQIIVDVMRENKMLSLKLSEGGGMIAIASEEIHKS